MKNVYRCSERKVIYNSLLKEHVNHKDKTHIVYEQSEHNLYSQCLYQFIWKSYLKTRPSILVIFTGNMWNGKNEHFIDVHLKKSSPISFQYNNMSSFSMSIMCANGHHKDLYAFNTTNHPLLISHVYTLCWLAKCTRTMDVCSFSEVKGLSKGLNPLMNHCSTLQQA